MLEREANIKYISSVWKSMSDVWKQLSLCRGENLDGKYKSIKIHIKIRGLGDSVVQIKQIVIIFLGSFSSFSRYWLELQAPLTLEELCHI